MKKSMLILLVVVLLAGCGGKLVPEPTAGASPRPTDLPEWTGPIQPQDKHRVYYEIFPGGFYDNDGDGMGDLNGITMQLDYINDNRADSLTSLHAGGLWLMPIMPSPTYHKYDVTDYYNVDPAYGTLADFDRLAAACAERGIALVLDLVVNHTSSQHPWFLEACRALAAGEESPFIDWYMFGQAGTPEWDEFKKMVGSGVYPVPGAPDWYYYGGFWSGMPDLNLDNEDLRQEILDIGAFWLARGATGFRLDATAHFFEGNTARNTAFLTWLQEGLGSEVYLVGEAWTDAGTILSLYQSGITSLFNFPFAMSTGTIISSVRTGDGAKLARAVERWHGQILEANPTAIDAPFLTNHDQARSSGALMGRLELQKQAAAVYLLLSGNPFIYYGEEIGMMGGGDKDEDKRMPFVWSLTDSTGMPNPPKGATNKTLPTAGLDEQLLDPDSLVRFYIDVIRIRNRYPTIARGLPIALDTGESAVCALQLTWKGETIFIYHNLGKVPVTLTVSGALIETLAAGGERPTLFDNTLTLPPWSTAVLIP
ncbi:MAG: alpha-amylase family glycosyl hydrolase [Clostridiales bacterium]|nr:alpha-amylase family glycosyl hydrolase [Clostridiales bacterium]